MVLFFFAFLIQAVLADGSNNTFSVRCPENPTFCVLDLLKTWEAGRRTETMAAHVLLPAIYYSQSFLSTLCESYSTISQKCGLGICNVNNSAANFVVQHFSFVCQNEIATKFFFSQSCITKTLNEAKCTELINEEPKIGGDLLCSKLDAFANCAETLRSTCGNEAYSLVMKTVETYGCLSRIDTAKVNAFLTNDVESVFTIREESVFSMKNVTIANLGENTEEDTDDLTTESVGVDDEQVSTSLLMTALNNFTSSPVPEAIILKTTTTNKASNSDIVQQTMEAFEGSGEFQRNEETSNLMLRVKKINANTEHFNSRMKKNNADNMTDCYTSIVADFGRFLRSSPTASFVRFPLFGIKLMELDVLCAKLKVATECVNRFCVGNCRLPPVKSFVDSQLKQTCMLRDNPDFGMEFTCLQNAMKKNIECISFVNSTNPNRCDGHMLFRNCIIDRLLGDCSEEAVRILDRMQLGFGCKLFIGQNVEESLDGSGEGEEGSGSGDNFTVNEQTAETESENKKRNFPNLTDDVLLTDAVEVKLRDCEGETKMSALSCVAPLLRLWTGIKENRRVTEAVFPIFEFSKIELLELCDAFANYRNCVKEMNALVCKKEPVINFVEEHFGQVCTTQQIEASMKTHNCIQSIDISEIFACQKFSKGDTLPGKRKCSKVRRYTKCLRGLVSSSCGHLILAQFDMIVHRFGC